MLNDGLCARVKGHNLLLWDSGVTWASLESRIWGAGFRLKERRHQVCLRVGGFRGLGSGVGFGSLDRSHCPKPQTLNAKPNSTQS